MLCCCTIPHICAVNYALLLHCFTHLCCESCFVVGLFHTFVLWIMVCWLISHIHAMNHARLLHYFTHSCCQFCSFIGLFHTFVLWILICCCTISFTLWNMLYSLLLLYFICAVNHAVLLHYFPYSCSVVALFHTFILCCCTITHSCHESCSVVALFHTFMTWILLCCCTISHIPAVNQALLLHYFTHSGDWHIVNIHTWWGWHKYSHSLCFVLSTWFYSLPQIIVCVHACVCVWGRGKVVEGGYSLF